MATHRDHVHLWRQVVLTVNKVEQQLSDGRPIMADVLGRCGAYLIVNIDHHQKSGTWCGGPE